MIITDHEIMLDGDEIASAIDLYISANGICVSGPRTISIYTAKSTTAVVAGDSRARVYVDPSGRIFNNGRAPVVETRAPIERPIRWR